MPNRIIRDGFVDSESVCALSDWAHRVYSNLLIKCDDAGRLDGRTELVRSTLFPLGTKRTPKDIEAAIKEMESAGVVLTYQFGSKPFIQVTKYQRCGSAEASRFPWIDGSHRIDYIERETRDGVKKFVKTSLPDGVGRGSVGGTDGVPTGSQTSSIELNTETETETETETGDDLPSCLDTSEFRMAWQEWKVFRTEKRAKLTDSTIKKQLKFLASFGPDIAIAMIDKSITSGWTGLFELKGKDRELAEEQDPEARGDDGCFHPIRDQKTIYEIMMNNP